MDRYEIANFLKSRRKDLNLSIKDVVNLLHIKGIEISDKTLYGWENGARQPDADVFVVLCTIYEVNSFSEINNNANFKGMSSLELQHIKKYRMLPEASKHAVDNIIDSMIQALDTSKETDKIKPEKEQFPEPKFYTTVTRRKKGGHGSDPVAQKGDSGLHETVGIQIISPDGTIFANDVISRQLFEKLKAQGAVIDNNQTDQVVVPDEVLKVADSDPADVSAILKKIYK